MSARDDYPLHEGPNARAHQRRQMLAEIDELRAKVAHLEAACSECGGKGWETCAEGAEQCEPCRGTGRALTDPSGEGAPA